MLKIIKICGAECGERLPTFDSSFFFFLIVRKRWDDVRQEKRRQVEEN